MKLKEYKGSLVRIKVKTSNGVIGYWRSQWGYKDGKAGVWLSEEEKSTQMYPQFLDSLEQCLEWEITEKESNCHELIDMVHINDSTDD